MNARFNLPDFYLGKDFYGKLVHTIRDNPYILLPNTEISAFFGDFPAAIWNGGGLEAIGSISREEMRDVIQFYNYELNMPVRFTFTNSLISETQYYDTYCNVIAELGHNGYNQILTSNIGLENYLRKNYPNYEYCRSIIGAEKEPYLLHGPVGDYKLSVMRRNMNNNWDYLEQIPMEDRTSIEFLVCDPCPDNCPRIYTHYRDFARSQIEYSLGNESSPCTMGDVKGTFFIHNMRTNCKTYISREMIDNEYLPRGFNEFKCSGRGYILSMLNAVTTYMVLPEYHDDMMFILLQAVGIN